MKRIMCGIFLIILSFAISVFNVKNDTDDIFESADSIKIVRNYSKDVEGVMCGNYVISDAEKLAVDNAVGYVITYNNIIDIKSLLYKLGARVERDYVINDCKVIEGKLMKGKVGGFKRVQIAISDKVIIGFPSIITGF